MARQIRITDIPLTEWVALLDKLADQGWRVSKGGGLDHFWATVQHGDLSIEMDWDNWFEGGILYSAAQAARIEALLPEAILVCPRETRQT